MATTTVQRVGSTHTLGRGNSTQYANVANRGYSGNFPKPLRSENYDDKFADVMHYAEINLAGRNKVKIRDKGDLLSIFRALNEHEERKSARTGRLKTPKLSGKFVEKLLKTQRSSDAVGKTMIGSTKARGTEVRYLKRTAGFFVTQEEKETGSAGYGAKEKTLVQQGRDVYAYDKGFAVASVNKRPSGKVVKSFRDTKTGRFVNKRTLREV